MNVKKIMNVEKVNALIVSNRVIRKPTTQSHPTL